MRVCILDAYSKVHIDILKTTLTADIGRNQIILQIKIHIQSKTIYYIVSIYNIPGGGTSV